jgi:hypothetical protein
MPKASHVTSTPSVDRRSILAAVGGVAAAGALSTAAQAVQVPPPAAQLSPEFRRWLKLATTMGEAMEAHNTWQEECLCRGKEERRDEDPINLHWDAMTELEEPIFKRPVLSWADVGELSLIAAYWSSEDKSEFACLAPEPEDYIEDRPQAFLNRAILSMMGGGNV